MASPCSSRFRGCVQEIGFDGVAQRMTKVQNLPQSLFGWVLRYNCCFTATEWATSADQSCSSRSRRRISSHMAASAIRQCLITSAKPDRSSRSGSVSRKVGSISTVLGCLKHPNVVFKAPENQYRAYPPHWHLPAKVG